MQRTTGKICIDMTFHVARVSSPFVPTHVATCTREECGRQDNQMASRREASFSSVTPVCCVARNVKRCRPLRECRSYMIRLDQFKRVSQDVRFPCDLSTACVSAERSVTALRILV